MLTRCPKCKTLFRTSDADLRQAGGKTRCSQCYTVFLATEASVDDGEVTQYGTPVMRSQAASALMQKLASKNSQQAATPSPSQNTTETNGMSNAASSIYNELIIKNRDVKYDIPDALDDQEIETPTLSPQAPETYEPISISDPAFNINPKEEANQRVAELTRSADQSGLKAQFEKLNLQKASNSNLSHAPSRHQAASAHEYSFIPDILQDDLYEDVHIPSASKNALLISTIILLLFASLLQYIYFMRTNLANNLTFRPVVVKFCKVFNCDVPYKKDILKIRQLTYSDEHETTNSKGQEIRVIRSQFVNTASFVQPFPIIEIVILGTKDNNPIAFRRVSPKKYLANKYIDLKKGLHPKTLVDLEIKYINPTVGKPSIQFKFK